MTHLEAINLLTRRARGYPGQSEPEWTPGTIVGWLPLTGVAP